MVMDIKRCCNNKIIKMLIKNPKYSIKHERKQAIILNTFNITSKKQ